jgi:hypothetical protein
MFDKNDNSNNNNNMVIIMIMITMIYENQVCSLVGNNH